MSLAQEIKEPAGRLFPGQYYLLVWPISDL